MRSLFSFPNPVNEVAARAVAAGVVLMCAAILLFRTPWLLWPLAYGFVARVATGPTLSPLGQLATRVIAPRIGHVNLVPGPPKRFAQGIGAAFTVGALITYYTAGATPALVLVAIILAFAVLESAFAICVGCLVFGRLQAVGLIPASVCQACNNLSFRRPAGAPAGG